MSISGIVSNTHAGPHLITQSLEETRLVSQLACIDSKTPPGT